MKREQLAAALEGAPDFEFSEDATAEQFQAEIDRDSQGLYGRELTELSAKTVKYLTRLIAKERSAVAESGAEPHFTREMIESLENLVDVDGHSGASLGDVRRKAIRYGKGVRSAYESAYGEIDPSVEATSGAPRSGRLSGALGHASSRLSSMS